MRRRAGVREMSRDTLAPRHERRAWRHQLLRGGRVPHYPVGNTRLAQIAEPIVTANEKALRPTRLFAQ